MSTTSSVPETTYPCPECDFESVSAAGLGSHRKAKHGVDGKAKAETNGEVVKRPRRKHFDAFLQEQNVETATAYVLAAKWPTGVPVEDLPRLVRLVKAVEHG